MSASNGAVAVSPQESFNDSRISVAPGDIYAAAEDYVRAIDLEVVGVCQGADGCTIPACMERTRLLTLIQNHKRRTNPPGACV